MSDSASEAVEILPPGAQLLGRQTISFDPVAGEAVLRFQAQATFVNRHGTVQGGFLAAMLDSATGSTIVAALPSGRTAVTTELITSFLRPAAPGPITARVRIISNDEKVAEVHGDLSDANGVVVARGVAKLRILSR